MSDLSGEAPRVDDVARAVLWATELGADRYRRELAALLQGDPVARTAHYPWPVTQAEADEQRRRRAALGRLGVDVAETAHAPRWLERAIATLRAVFAAETRERAGIEVVATACEVFFALDAAELLRKLEEEAPAAASLFADAARDQARAAAAAAERCRAAIARLTEGRFHASLAPALGRVEASLTAPKALRSVLADLPLRLATPRETPIAGPPTAEELDELARILTHPVDDAPRALFGELAARRGDPRAELVRLQLESSRSARITRTLWDPPRARFVVEAHPEWLEPVTSLGAKRAWFHRGFVEEIEIDAGDYLANARALYAVAPILSVRLRNLGDRIADVAACPALAGLLALDLVGQHVTDDGAARLAASPHVRSLRQLELADNSIGERGVDALAGSPNLARLRVCTLKGNPCGPLCTFEYTLQEIPTQEAIPTELGRRLAARHGSRPWFWDDPTHPGPVALACLVEHALRAADLPARK